MANRIDSAVAKSIIEKINDELKEKHLLIGGLAVQQYITTRQSKDIDLVCDFDTATRILKKLFPSKDWELRDEHDNEYRPSYRITNRIEDFGEIVFGPKITEREPYKHINWKLLKENARTFRYQNKPLSNILIPNPAALAFAKLISFINTSDRNKDKLSQDIDDFVELSNHNDFSIIIFYSIIRKSKALESITKDFAPMISPYFEKFKESCLYEVAQVLGFAPKHNNEVAAGINAPEIKANQIDVYRDAISHMSWDAKDIKCDVAIDMSLDFMFSVVLAEPDQEFTIYYKVLADNNLTYWIGYRQGSPGANVIEKESTQIVSLINPLSTTIRENVIRTFSNRFPQHLAKPIKVMKVRFRGSDRIQKPVLFNYIFF